MWTRAPETRARTVLVTLRVRVNVIRLPGRERSLVTCTPDAGRPVGGREPDLHPAHRPGEDHPREGGVHEGRPLDHRRGRVQHDRVGEVAVLHAGASAEAGVDRLRQPLGALAEQRPVEHRRQGQGLGATRRAEPAVVGHQDLRVELPPDQGQPHLGVVGGVGAAVDAEAHLAGGRRGRTLTTSSATSVRPPGSVTRTATTCSPSAGKAIVRVAGPTWNSSPSTDHEWLSTPSLS